jgi:hypothetical protein
MRVLLSVLLTALSLTAATQAVASTPSQRLDEAVRMRLLPVEQRVGLRDEDPDDVAAVAALICEIHVARPRCGGFCTSTRADRRDIPYYGDTVVEEVDCWDTARLLVAGAEAYDVPLPDLLATAYIESTFRELAIGSGTECGMFQQSTRWIRWASDDIGVTRMPFATGQDTCRYLLRTENALLHFAIKYHHERRQSGANWAAHYNGSANMWTYKRRHDGLRVRFARYVDAYVVERPDPATADAANPGADGRVVAAAASVTAD